MRCWAAPDAQGPTPWWGLLPGLPPFIAGMLNAGGAWWQAAGTVAPPCHAVPAAFALRHLHRALCTTATAAMCTGGGEGTFAVRLHDCTTRPLVLTA